MHTHRTPTAVECARYGPPLTHGGKQILGVVLLLVAVGSVIGFVVANNDYEQSTQLRDVDRYRGELGGYSSTLEVTFDQPPPDKPNPLVYFGAATASLVGSLVMFTMAARDRALVAEATVPVVDSGTADTA